LLEDTKRRLVGSIVEHPLNRALSISQALYNVSTHVRSEANLRDEVALWADPVALAAAVRERLLRLYVMRVTRLDGEPTIDVFMRRLEALAEPERLFVIGAVLDHKDYKGEPGAPEAGRWLAAMRAAGARYSDPQGLGGWGDDDEPSGGENSED